MNYTYKLLFLFSVILCSLSCHAQDLIITNGDATVTTVNNVVMVSDSIAAEKLMEEDFSEIESAQAVGFMEGTPVAGNTVFDYKKTKYWERYKTLRTTGWLCFFGSYATAFVGYGLILAAFASSSKFTLALGYLGFGLMYTSPFIFLASIPILSIAYYNKHLAKRMKFDVGVSQIPANNFSRNKFSSPALSLAFNF